MKLMNTNKDNEHTQKQKQVPVRQRQHRSLSFEQKKNVPARQRSTPEPPVLKTKTCLVDDESMRNRNCRFVPKMLSSRCCFVDLGTSLDHFRLYRMSFCIM